MFLSNNFSSLSRNPEARSAPQNPQRDATPTAIATRTELGLRTSGIAENASMYPPIRMSRCHSYGYGFNLWPLQKLITVIETNVSEVARTAPQSFMGGIRNV